MKSKSIGPPFSWKPYDDELLNSVQIRHQKGTCHKVAPMQTYTALLIF